MNKKVIRIQSNIRASIEEVWNCWTTPKHIIQWNFANDEWCCPTATNDLRPNGKFNWRMEAKDGSMGFNFEGRYIYIVNHELIAYQLVDGRSVKVEFSKDGNAVKLIQLFEAEGRNSDEQQKKGWQAIMNNFKTYVESAGS